MFTAELDRRCQQGLHWRYVIDEAHRPPDSHFPALHALLLDEPDVVHVEEAWGQRPIHRYVRPFRYELRLWTRAGELSFLHRTTAAAATRKQDREQLDAHLMAWLRDSYAS